METTLRSLHVCLTIKNSITTSTLLIIDGEPMRCILLWAQYATSLIAMKLLMMIPMIITSVTHVFKKTNWLLMETTSIPCKFTNQRVIICLTRIATKTVSRSMERT